MISCAFYYSGVGKVGLIAMIDIAGGTTWSLEVKEGTTFYMHGEYCCFLIVARLLGYCFGGCSTAHSVLVKSGAPKRT